MSRATEGSVERSCSIKAHLRGSGRAAAWVDRSERHWDCRRRDRWRCRREKEDTLVSPCAELRVAERAAERESLVGYHASCYRGGEVPSYRSSCHVGKYRDAAFQRTHLRAHAGSGTLRYGHD
jgi:hypothetical protein